MKFYLVEFLNELTLTRQYVQAEGNNAQAAIDLARERVDEQANWTVANVWEETQEAWE